MAYSSFPTYAQFLLDSYEPTHRGGLVRDDMEDGFIHQAPAYTLGRVELPVVYRLPNLGDKDAFEAWRRDTLKHGALWFEWPDPADYTGNTTYRARIVGGTVKYKPLTARLDDWQASFTLEYFA